MRDESAKKSEAEASLFLYANLSSPFSYSNFARLR